MCTDISKDSLGVGGVQPSVHSGCSKCKKVQKVQKYFCFFYLFGRLCPELHQKVFLELLGAGPRCLEVFEHRIRMTQQQGSTEQVVERSG